MKLLKTSILICIIICSFSCQKKNTKNMLQERNEIELIIIEFHPSFIDPSMAIFDISKNIVVFKRIGLKWYFSPREDPIIETIDALKTISFKLDSCDYLFLKDSLHFNDNDFLDREIFAEDGAVTSILYIKDTGEIEDVDLNNDITNNQKELISRLIDSAVAHSKDSISSNYFRTLKKYYR